MIKIIYLSSFLRYGQCNTAITPREKFKKLKNGEFNRHVYYNCTRRVDINCNEKYINENDLCVLLQEFVEKNHDSIKINDRLRAKTEKHYQTAKALLEHYRLNQELDTPFIEYSRYVLDRGTEAERINYANGIITKLLIIRGTLTMEG